MVMPDKFTRYCCGLLFRGRSIPGASGVLLTRKLKPNWQDGLLNGHGGKINAGEQATAAMFRETAEEIGGGSNVSLSVDWHQFATETGTDYVVHFFRALAQEHWVAPSQNDVGEALCWVPLPNGVITQGVVGNLKWLVPLAMDWRELRSPNRSYGGLEIITQHEISRRPSW